MGKLVIEKMSVLKLQMEKILDTQLFMMTLMVFHTSFHQQKKV